MLELFTQGLIIVLVLAVVIIVAYGLFYLIETVGAAEHHDTGKVSEVAFTEGHYIHVYNAGTKTSLPQWVAATWSVSVTIRGDVTDWMECTEELYDSIERGTSVLAAYRLGRVTGRKYLFGVTKL